MSQLSRLKNALRSGPVDQELDEELQFHLEERRRDLVAGGASSEEARFAARRAFGNLLLLRESSREAKLAAWLESIVQDVRYGLRMAAKYRLLTAVSVLSLSLAIGVSTAAFSLVNALILRPLPVADPHSLIYLTANGPGPGGDLRSTDNVNFSYPLLLRLREVAARDASLFGVSYGGPQQTAEFGENGVEEPVRPQWISGEGFGILGIPPALGRLLEAGDDTRPAGDSAAVLGYRFWKRRFGGDPDVVGRRVKLVVRGFEAGRYRIVGVAAKGFSGLEPGAPADLWLPLITRQDRAWVMRPVSDFFQIRGRLSEGVQPEQLQSRLQAAFTAFRKEWAQPMLPRAIPPKDAERYRKATLSVRPASDTPSYLRTLFERPLWIVAAMAGLVLLLACSNVANLFIARAEAREREMALRAAIGAEPARLARQMLIESLLIAAASSVLALAIAAAVSSAAVRLLAPPDFPAFLDLGIDWRVLGFLGASGAVAAALLGIVPAIRASGAAPNTALKSRPDGHSHGIAKLRPLLAAQVAISFAVLFTGGLLLRSFTRLISADLGFEPSSVVLYSLAAPERDVWAGPEAAKVLLPRVRALPGVRSASVSTWGLLSGVPRARSTVRGLPGGLTARPGYMGVSAGFFETMGIPLVAGRDFRSGDPASRDGAPVVVNETFARVLLAGRDPLGVRFERMDAAGAVPQEIVGVVRDSKYNSAREEAEPSVFVHFARVNGATLEVLAAGVSGPELKKVIERAVPGVRITAAIPQEQQVANSMLKERLLALLACVFVLEAAILAGVGVAGVLNYSVVRQTKEIGIRLALGARPLEVLRAVSGGVAAVVAAGIAAGLAAGIVLARFLDPVLYSVRPVEVWSVVLPLGWLLAAAVLASLPAAVRAVRVDPCAALRQD